ncbi:Dynamin-like GTPase that mediates homotypic ER fusion [Tulasnella sp. 418]|nr:Dynamin-like GTPase that mediates homotypic ER fusion [Tulasnella sp. 418]
MVSTDKTPNGTTDVGDRIQIVDENKNFNGELNKYIAHWGLIDAGFQYNVVAVFGSQSTGKSTLLNRLFGTTFDVMDETRRQQTTKGIWMCRGKNTKILVMDVEGTDGRERGEDQDFERKSALFSMASSEVLIVNIWEHQVGLYQGANMGLLKTVFEVNLGLFGKQSTNQRTLLLFVIRDHVGTPMQNLQATLTADMMRIWDSISKPEGLTDRKLSDYFDLAFESLPHKLLMPEKFESDVVKLRGRFTDSNRPDFVFKPAYHKRIPADGVSHYMDSIWEQVQTNKDLDLPTQQELLAQFRCGEIAAGVLEEFNIQVKGQRKPIESGRVVEGLGKMMSNWTKHGLARFDTAASRYHQGVYTRKRQDLITQLNSTLSALYFGQLKNLHRTVLSSFKSSITDGIRAGGNDYDFGVIVRDARSKAQEQFENGAKEASGLSEGEILDPDWTYDEEFEQLKQEMSLVADQCRKDETKKMVNSIERNFKKQISEPVELHLNVATSSMWDKVLTTFKETLETAESTYLSKAKGFNSTEEEDAQSLYIIRKRAWMALRAKIDEQTADTVILTKLRNHFEERFRYDEKGVPRVWKPEDDIDGAFRKARDKTLELIPIYAKIQPSDSSLVYTLPPPPPATADSSEELNDPDFDFASTFQVLTETKQLDVVSRFRKDADAYYIEAKRSTVSSVAQIPTWMYGVLVVLGWNEFIAVLSNPLYFAFLLGAVAVGWVIIQLGLVGPLFQVTKTVTNEIQRQATDRLREHFSQPQLAPPISRQSTNASMYTAVDTPDRLSRRSTAATFKEEDDFEMKSL